MEVFVKKIVLNNPGISTTNLGDVIIAESAKKEIDFLLRDAYVVEVSTHLPLSLYYMRYLKKVNYRFVLGSNLLKSTFFGFKRQWDITYTLATLSRPSILMGVGWWQYNNKPNLYTEALLKSVLSKKYLHSVRDDYTEKMLRKMGISNVINTACPTMWALTAEHCATIPLRKSDSVIFTLTDYSRDLENDRKLIELLIKSYKRIYFWPQGIFDFEYFNDICVDKEAVKIINPSLSSFDNLLASDNIDYVGTRLHGGIRALQKKVRTIIISIDNRAKEIGKSFNIPVVERDNIIELNNMVHSEFSTSISLPLDNINLWKNQFHDDK